MDYRDYYQTLGVPRDASADAIKKAFRRLARQYHPDVSKEPDAAARMSEINEAHAVLSDPERRAAYDAMGQGHRPGESFTPPPDWDEGFEFSGRGAAPGMDEDAFSDFFSHLFGRMGAQRAGRSSAGTHAAMRGEDHHARIVLALADAWHGTTRQVTLRHPELDAQGRVVLQERTLDVKIPSGVKPGQLIRLVGQGAPGQGDAPAGDLFLEVHYRAAPGFDLIGDQLTAELPVAPWEAALGTVVPVQMPDGSTLQVRVPAGAQAGQSLTVRGKGLPAREGAGDLELVVRVLLPSALDPRARALYEQMARDLPDFDARRQARA